ncbi:MAG: AGE family epimerase/isomerase [Bacteroidetes bacterium]|nr:AGE family epimerase/isomerase [Bacteroidota bacterium]
MPGTLLQYKTELQDELESILSFWMNHTVDEQHGGFVGQIDGNNTVQPNAPKGVVMHARILWAFASAYHSSPNEKYLQTANRAFAYLHQHFFDPQYKGVYWLVNHLGKPLDTKKQVYAQAFVLYALSVYYQVTKNSDAINAAIDLFEVIHKHGYDPVYGGYTEAFTREWQEIPDQRLSAKDANEKKSMNTNLHVLEALTALYRVWPYEQCKEKIISLIDVFLQYIIDPETHHQHLFFDEQWKVKSAIISYGHDIETAWLLQEAAEVVGDETLIHPAKQNAVNMAQAVTAALDTEGGLWYEYDALHQLWIKEKHWWPQAEAMVGFFNAWQVNGDEKWLQNSIGVWRFVQQHILDKKNGEWFWGVDEKHQPLKEDKTGVWKCPYHNSRACMEIIKRINDSKMAHHKIN